MTPLLWALFGVSAAVTAGPVVITSGFIGYLAAGVVGAVLAAAGTFVLPYVIVVVAARCLRKPSPRLKAFVAGVTASAAGAIAGAASVLGRRAVFDVATSAIALATRLALRRTKKVPQAIWIALAGATGTAIQGLGRP